MTNDNSVLVEIACNTFIKITDIYVLTSLLDCTVYTKVGYGEDRVFTESTKNVELLVVDNSELLSKGEKRLLEDILKV